MVATVFRPLSFFATLLAAVWLVCQLRNVHDSTNLSRDIGLVARILVASLGECFVYFASSIHVFLSSARRARLLPLSSWNGSSSPNSKARCSNHSMLASIAVNCPPSDYACMHKLEPNQRHSSSEHIPRVGAMQFVGVNQLVTETRVVVP